MNVFTSKTVLTLTAFMSVNSAFANTLPPSYDAPVNQDAVATKKVETKNNDLRMANSLPPTPEKMANTLPPTFDWNQKRILARNTINFNHLNTSRVRGA